MLAVANFHYIRHDFNADYPSIYGLSPKQFKDQLKELAKYGRFVSQAEVLEGIPENDKAILITFDDGLKEQFDLAKPILDELKIPFICFVNTSNFTERKVSLVHKIHLLRSKVPPSSLLNEIEKKSSICLDTEEVSKATAHYNYDSEEVATLKYLLNFKLGLKELKQFTDRLFENHFNESVVVDKLYMTSQQLQELWSNDNLGSHGHHHDPLGMLNLDEAQENLKNTQQFFEDEFGARARSFSYPYGSYEASKGLEKILQNAGFEVAFTMERALNRDTSGNRYLLGRYDCNDLPGGKANLFKTTTLFQDPDFSKW
ncbi:polysaccharide deacetylase family protein [Gramella sp. GC03-9]|uniref:Polysaccharide deacetylase family protein n=1 Tax=Christiangramia oceanisediminis TaxID=2920386 RepID=A0A9X2I0B4_9FLAO|nr:polysaccharide deacetylase family protein [Gramella oceanisediminis]MCP9198305.1 polysaccharide deacetylase family protein [Gramella oceanisediminis]